MIEGLSHITLVVSDIARSVQLLRDVLGATVTYASGDETFSLSREVFLDVGGVWLVLMEGDALPARSYNHIAFKIDEAEYEACLARVEASGVEMLPPRARVEGEGRSIYFHDFDNHLFELHTGTLAVRLARYAKGKAP
ncbi:MAG: FosX/FosE/FosI family fosfomycin resistance hydrolase [Bosea sp. (in: a-proteobacteria)]